MGACCQKQARQRAENSKSAIVPSWHSPPAYIDDDEGKVQLVGDVTCPYTQRVRIALLFKGIPVDASLVMPDDLRGHGETLASLSPDGRFPAFQHGDTKITGSVDSILAYIDESFPTPPLLPGGLEKEAAQWVAYVRDTFTPAVEEALHNGDPYQQGRVEASLRAALAHLDAALSESQRRGRGSGGKFFLGAKFSLVDVYLIPFLALVDLVAYIRGSGIPSDCAKLLSYKAAMGAFKVYKPVQVGTDLSKAILVRSAVERLPQPVVSLAMLQHRSIVWQLEAFAKMVRDFDARNQRVDSRDVMERTLLTTRLRELPRVYGCLLDLLQEHAQMEERVIFPALESANHALTESALRDHARDLPVMNGIREDIKGVVALRQGNHDHREALSSLAERVEAFEAHVKEHFEEEEKEQLPLLQAAGYGTRKQQPMVVQALAVMEATHSRLLPFLLQGLKPHEVHQYLGLMTAFTSDYERNSALPRIAHALNSSDDYESVRKVAVERVPALGGPQYTRMPSRPSLDQGEHAPPRAQFNRPSLDQGDSWYARRAVSYS